MVAYDFSNLNVQQVGNDNNAIVCYDCDSGCDNTREVEKKIFNEVKNASSIFGVFDLKLGQTTEKDLGNEYEKQESKDFFENRICFYTRSSYKLDRIEQIKNIKLYFLDNILVRIIFDICANYKKTPIKIEYKEKFIEKYGQGIGAYIEYERTGRGGEYKYKIEKIFDESRSWENAIIDVFHSCSKYSYGYFIFTLKEKWNLVIELENDFKKKNEEKEHLEKEKTDSLVNLYENI